MSQQTIKSMPKAKILYHLLLKEKGYYEAILEITKQEHRKFTNERPFEEIMPLFKKKKILLACIDEIEEALQPIKRWWADEEQDPHDPWTTQAKEQIEQIEIVMQEVLSLDQRNQQMCQSLLKMLRDKSRA